MPLLDHFDKSKHNQFIIYRLKDSDWDTFLKCLPEGFRLCYIADKKLEKLSKQPSKVMTLLGLGSIAMLLGLMLAIGIISLNYKIFLSIIPFMLISILTILNRRKRRAFAN